MISNSNQYKLKASKSSRDLNDENKTDDSSEEDNSRWLLKENDRGYGGKFGKNRSRSYDYRSRSERRGSWRGRGGGSGYAFRKYENETEGGGSYRKFQEPLNSKYKYDLDKGKEAGSFLEDTRISTLIRKLTQESDQDKSLVLCKRLLEAIIVPDNARYVRRSFQMLVDNLLEVLYHGPGAITKRQAARVLGRVGYVMDVDFQRYFDFLLDAINNAEEEIKILLLKSLKETFSLEKKNPKLTEFSPEIMHQIQIILETVDGPEPFMVTVEILLALEEIYPELFSVHFQDVVDILLGWLIDKNQSVTIIEFSSKSLIRLSTYWQNNLQFPLYLVNQFFEDLEPSIQQLEMKLPGPETTEDVLERITSTFRAFGTVLKCLDTKLNPNNSTEVSLTFITDYLGKVINFLTLAIESYVPDNLIISGNECIAILLSNLPTKPSNICEILYVLVDLQLSLIQEFSDPTIISMLLLISRIIKEISANLPFDLVQKIVGPKSELIKLRFSQSEAVQNAVVDVYHSLLNLKNIPLLQEAYRCVLGDLEQAFKLIVPTIPEFCPDNPFPATESNAELNCLFSLRCLSLIAIESSSIIGMWALRPTILELLANNLQPYNSNLTQTPSLQYCIFYLLYSHCKCYNYFVPSSCLVKTEIELPNSMNLGVSSPSSGNLTIILEILSKSLRTSMNIEIKQIIFQWLQDIIIHSKIYLDILAKTQQFKEILYALINSGYSCDKIIVQAVATNLKILLNFTTKWDYYFLNSINSLCILHVNSNSKLIRDSYSEVLSQLPWFITILNCNKISTNLSSNLSVLNKQSVEYAQHLQMKRSVGGEMLQFQFKKFTQFLLKGQPIDEMLDIFTCCSGLENQDFRALVMNSRTLLYFWITWEAALLCVNNKLRTPLGKPTETFTCIENAVKQLAKESLGLADKDNTLTAQQEQTRVCLLLEFMEHLEKVIYNASYGCADVLLPPTKPVRTFFHTNASTCREWLTRIRLPVINVALNAGYSTTVIRHAQLKLLDLKDQTNSLEFEKTVLYLAQALLNLNEYESIHGLYIWACKVSNRDLLWLKYTTAQANKRYEQALTGYQGIFENNDLEDYLSQFVSNQITQCYKNLNSWPDIITWAETEVKNGFNTDLKFAKIAIAHEENSLKCLEELSDWKHESTSKWGSKETLIQTELNIFEIALKLQNPNPNLNDLLNKNLSIIQNNIQDSIRNLPSDNIQDFLLLQHIVIGLKNIAKSKQITIFDVGSDLKKLNNINSAILSKVLFWAEYLKLNENITSKSLLNLKIHGIKRARKEGNINYSLKQMNNLLAQKDLFMLNETNGKQLLDNVAQFLIQSTNKLDKNVWNLENAKAVREVVKILYANENKRNIAINVCAAAAAGVSSQVNFSGSEDLKECGSRLIITLSKWIQRETDQQLVKEVNSPLGRLIMVIPDVGFNDNRQVIPTLDMAAGKLLQFGVRQYSKSTKIWSTYGEWCYLWGKNALENGITLTDADKLLIQQHLPDLPAEDLHRIYDILSQTKIIPDKDVISNELNMAEQIETQLESVLPCIYHENLSHLVQIWRLAQNRIYHYYELSAEAFFHCLQLCTSCETIRKGTECLAITATLRLLRFIVKHAMELKSVLENGLANTPTHPWKAIIPQLFARLNHPEEYVRLRVSELLCRIAEIAPHLIIFPAVVGAVEGGHKFDLSDITMPKDYLTNNEPVELDIEDEDDDSENEESRDVLHSCFMQMVETLSKQAPDTITQVQSFISELRRISLLWDELWISTLIQHHSEITKRLAQLESEITKTENNHSLTNDEKDQLIAEKHRIIIKPIVFILEQLHAITSREPETPHEVQFQERYLDLINEVLDTLKNPKNPHKPQESWQPLKNLQCKLQQRAHKRASFALKMSEISPVLANMNNTVIAMPGLARNAIKKVTITSISTQVNVLPTKTKPKKLFFHGSDGHTYTYLFKGMEDLHLDERIMQFLTIANTMMAKTTDINTNNIYRARNYSVIPLGLRSGLIRWVDGTIPMFSLYKRWQLREAGISLKQSTEVLRPSELFYNKLNPLLKEHGVKNLENRKEWPLAALKQVLTELMAETPNDLLAKELWCRSVNAGAWWQVTKNYSYSVAVMSIIGYIIGLGDRHLDNVLVDLTSGEVVHIDYNVCFEKGKQLRVPEKVPFRMTPNMEAALGVTGVEGIFRLACENVLEIMQKGRETLLTLLEAFVYDPLVDWTPGAEGLAGAVLRTVAPSVVTKQARRDLEREVTVSMFHVRCAEMQAEWVTNRDDILLEMTTIVEELNKWILEEKKIKQADDNLLELHQQMTLITEAEYHGRNHPLYTLPKRFTLYQETQSCLNNARKGLEDKIKEYENHLVAHHDAMTALRGNKLSQWINELNFPLEHENHRIFDIIKEFLQNAGQTTMITQCEQLETEVTQLAQQQLLYIRTCLDLFGQYGTVASLYPASYLEKHRSVLYINWCKRLLETKSLDVCLDIVTEYNGLFSPEAITSPLAKMIISFSIQLQKLLSETNLRLQKSFDRLNVEGIPDSGSRLDKTYTDTLSSIAIFLRNEKGANIAFECVNISALCALNKRYLTMEAAAASAGEYLVDLTSRDGDWFLDEMHLMSSLVTELSNLIPLQHTNLADEEDTKIPVALNCIKTANNIYKGLQELNFNFHTIILPETIKTIQTEERTVLNMINDLNAIILNIGYPLPEILNQLDLHLRFTVMEMESPHLNVQNLIADLRTNYEALLHSQSSSETLTPGQMLLMGFNGLFEKLQGETDSLITTLASLDTPACWKKADQFREAKALSAPVFSEQTRSVLADIFLLKRVQTMSEFFSLCGQMCRAFKGVGVATVFDDDRLSKPIKRFTADYVSRQLLGVTSQTIALALCFLLQRLGINVTNEIEQRDIGAENKVPLEDLCRKAIDFNLKNGVFTGNILAQASGLCSNLETSWRKREIARYMQQNVEIQRSTLQRIQLQLTAHYWLHEDVIMLQPSLAAMSPLIRSNFLLELRKTCSNLLALQSRLAEAREKQKNLILNVEQRLKWAAGANPDLSEIMASFECAVNIRDDRLNVEQKLAVTIGNTCNTILHHEALRTRTSEAIQHDNLFVQLVKSWESSCRMLVECTEEVSPAEASLIQIMPVDGKIDPQWIQSASVKLQHMIVDTQKSNQEKKEKISVLFDQIKTDITKLKTMLNTHHKLFSDVRNLLKTMAKLEDCSADLHKFLRKYRRYLEIFTAVVHKFTKEQDTTENNMIEVLNDLNLLKQQTNEIYDQLLNLNDENYSNKSRPPLIRQDIVWMSPRKGVPEKKKAGKEQRNAYAIAVWHKVRLKLEGRDPDPGVKYSLQEQVDHVIKEATNLDNLALLYEGWTPWV